MKKISVLSGVLMIISAAIVVVALIAVLMSDNSEKLDHGAGEWGMGRSVSGATTEASAEKSSLFPTDDKSTERKDDSEDGDDDSDQDDESRSGNEEEKLVDEFDALTDKWMEPSKAGVTMKDVDTFVKTFRNVPENRRDECVHRALNLIPDENVMLLAGVLMDKTMDKEIVETVFNDVLNRDEDVKKPIMKEIYKDRSHPCWADVAWILDVTGENKE